jgi:hypothetical protein
MKSYGRVGKSEKEMRRQKLREYIQVTDDKGEVELLGTTLKEAEKHVIRDDATRFKWVKEYRQQISKNTEEGQQFPVTAALHYINTMAGGQDMRSNLKHWGEKMDAAAAGIILSKDG